MVDSIVKDAVHEHRAPFAVGDGQLLVGTQRHGHRADERALERLVGTDPQDHRAVAPTTWTRPAATSATNTLPQVSHTRPCGETNGLRASNGPPITASA